MRQWCGFLFVNTLFVANTCQGKLRLFLYPQKCE